MMVQFLIHYIKFLKNLEVKMDVIWEALNPIMDYINCVDEKKARNVI